MDKLIRGAANIPAMVLSSDAYRISWDIGLTVLEVLFTRITVLMDRKAAKGEDRSCSRPRPLYG